MQVEQKAEEFRKVYGAVKNAKVVAFVEEHQPGLVSEGRVDLGSIRATGAVGAVAVQDWLSRLGGYVLLRHRFKESVRNRRKSRKRTARRSW